VYGSELIQEQRLSKLAGGGTVQLTLSLDYTTLTSVDQLMDHLDNNVHPPTSSTGQVH